MSAVAFESRIRRNQAPTNGPLRRPTLVSGHISLQVSQPQVRPGGSTVQLQVSTLGAERSFVSPYFLTPLGLDFFFLFFKHLFFCHPVLQSLPRRLLGIAEL